ncbi:hypothetical protein Agub_g13029, partial [Astrephomene gubernaculifera]
MRRAAGRCVAQFFRDASHASSACSTSGRPVSEQGPSLAKRLMGGSSSAARFDFFDPSRNVYKEFQPKWDRANKAAAEAAAAAAAETGILRPNYRPTDAPAAAAASTASTQTSAPAVAPVLKDADWPPGYSELLRSFLQSELPLSSEEAGRLVEAARRGLLPASREVIRTRYMHIKDLEPRFPGFNARTAVLGEPRLLLHSASKLMRAMLVFQDHWTASAVGPLMGRIGEFIVRDPAGVGARLHVLSRALSYDVGTTLDPRQLTPGSAFLTCSPYEVEARVSAVATIFGREGASRLLAADIDVLCFAPRQLDEAVLALREVFAAAGHGVPREHHAGTPEGRAAAAADRAYVTELAVAWPGLLALPGRVGEAGVAQLVAAVRA